MRDFGNIIKREIDNSYVINDGMYHVPNIGEWIELYAEVNEYATAHPEKVTIEPIPPIPPAPPEPTLEEIKQWKINELNNKSNELMKQVQSGYTQGEINTFEQQHKGAVDILAGNEATVEALFVLAILNGRLGHEPSQEEKIAFANRIINNYNQAAIATANILGKQQNLVNRVYAAQTKEEVEAISWDEYLNEIKESENK